MANKLSVLRMRHLSRGCLQIKDLGLAITNRRFMVVLVIIRERRILESRQIYHVTLKTVRTKRLQRSDARPYFPFAAIRILGAIDCFALPMRRR